ncbi:MAG: hypothetical protein V1734_06310 [Nanoarchaeota archaeon]
MAIESIVLEGDTEGGEGGYWVDAKMYCSCGKKIKTWQWFNASGNYDVGIKCPSCKTLSHVAYNITAEPERWNYEPSVLNEQCNLLETVMRGTYWLGRLKAQAVVGCECGASHTVERKFMRRSGSYIQDSACPKCKKSITVKHDVEFREFSWGVSVEPVKEVSEKQD